MKPELINRKRRCLFIATACFGLVGVSPAINLLEPAHAQVLSPQPHNIVTVAGTGVAGLSGEKIPAVAAQLNSPGFVVFDSVGNMIFSEALNHRVRRIDAAGIVTTVVGTGIPGFNGDNIPATTAQIFFTRGLTFDSVGNLLVNDVVNNRVRMVTPGSDGILGAGDPADEIITTVIGGGTLAGPNANGQPGIMASLGQPGFTVFDSEGNLYLSEVFNHRVWKVTRSPDAPTGDGNIDGDLDEIITIIAGASGLPCSPDTTDKCGDEGPALAAKLFSPNRVDLDSKGNLYIADVASNRVRFVNLGTTETTILGKPSKPGTLQPLLGLERGARYPRIPAATKGRQPPRCSTRCGQ